MQEILNILNDIWNFIQDIISSLFTFLDMLGDTINSAYSVFHFDFLPDPLMTCMILLFTTAVVKVLLTMGSSSV